MYHYTEGAEKRTVVTSNGLYTYTSTCSAKFFKSAYRETRFGNIMIQFELTAANGLSLSLSTSEK